MKPYIGLMLLVFLGASVTIIYKVDREEFRSKTDIAYKATKQGARCTAADCLSFCEAFLHIDSVLKKKKIVLDIKRRLPAVCGDE